MSFLDGILEHTIHGASHVDTDPIPEATVATPGLMSAADKTALDTYQADVTALETQVLAAQGDITTLQGDLTTAQADIATVTAANAYLNGLRLAEGVYVEDYTVGGAPLDASNFEAALNAAIAAATAASGAPEGSNVRGSVPVFVPTGNWLMLQGIVIHNTAGGARRAPSLIGRGAPGSTILRFHPSATFPGIMLGCNADGTVEGQYCIDASIDNIHIYMSGGVAVRGGIRARNTVQCRIRNVLIRGAGTDPGPWHQRVGLDFRDHNEGEVSPSPLQNHQHLYLDNVAVYYSLIGLWLGNAVWSCTAVNLNLNGCEHSAVFESAVVGWFGGNVQGGIGEGARYSSGMMYTTGLPSGAAADVTASSGGTSTVTNVTGLQGSEGDGASATHRGCFITIGDNIYRIDEVISPTACTILRASGGALVGQAWQVRGGAGGNQIQITGGVYTETTSGRALLRTGRDFTSASSYLIQSVVSKTAQVCADISACSGNVTVRNVLFPGILAARLRQCERFDTDAAITQVDTDDVSLGGITARRWDNRPRSLRYNNMFLERGGGCFDARRTSSVPRSASDVLGWQDITGDVTLGLVNAGLEPIWVASDAGLGAPAIQCSSSVGANLTHGLTGNIGSLMPQSGKRFFPTLFVVARIPSAASAALGQRRVSLTATNFSTYIGFDDAGHSTSRDFYAFQYWLASQALMPDLVDADTLAHWVFSANQLSERRQAGAGSDRTEWTVGQTNWGHHPRGILPGSAVTLNIMPEDAAANGTLLISHVGWIPRGITEGEREQFLQAALNEFNIEP